MNREVALTVVARLLMLVFGLVTSIITARWLGPAARGDYSAMVIFAASIVQFGNFGLNSTVTYQLAGDHSRLAGLTANCVWISLLWGGGLSAIVVEVIIILGIWPEVPRANLWLGAAMVPSTMFFTLGSSLLVSMKQIAFYNALQIISSTAIVATLVVARAVDGNLTVFLMATAIAWAFSSLLVYAALRFCGAKSLRFRRDLLHAGWQYSGKAYLVCLLGFLLLRSNIFALERFAAPSEVGYYAVASQAADMLLILPTSVGVVLFPRLVRDEKSRWETTRQSMLRVAALMTFASLAAAVLIKPAITLAFGTAYLPSVPVLIAMLPGVFFLSLVTVLSQFLAAQGMPRAQVVFWAAGVAVLALSSRLLIPSFAAFGAALSFSLASGVTLALQGVFVLASRPAKQTSIAKGTTYPQFGA